MNQEDLSQMNALIDDLEAQLKDLKRRRRDMLSPVQVGDLFTYDEDRWQKGQLIHKPVTVVVFNVGSTDNKPYYSIAYKYVKKDGRLGNFCQRLLFRNMKPAGHMEIKKEDLP